MRRPRTTRGICQKWEQAGLPYALPALGALINTHNLSLLFHGFELTFDVVHFLAKHLPAKNSSAQTDNSIIGTLKSLLFNRGSQ